MKNIEAFDRCTASIFASLYSEFPVPINIEFSNVPLEIFDEEESEEEVFDKFFIYEHTVNWLVGAGYVNASVVNNQTAFGLVLSAKGLEVLKLPASLEAQSPSFGEKIVESVKSGAIEAAKNGAKLAITKGLMILSGGDA